MIYSPREDSLMLKQSLRTISKGKSVLDIGTGSGILALSALSEGASFVTASDINPEAVHELSKIKKEKNLKNLQVLHSNLFAKIKNKFDIIVFNPPYLPEDKNEPKDSALATTGGKNGDEIVLKFLRQAPKYLNKNGIILLLLSSLTPKDKILTILENSKLKFKVISSEKIFFETLEVWKISKE